MSKTLLVCELDQYALLIINYVVGTRNLRGKALHYMQVQKKEGKKEGNEKTNPSSDSPRPSTLPLFPHLIAYVMQCAMADLKIPLVSHVCLALFSFNTKFFVSSPGVLNRG